MARHFVVRDGEGSVVAAGRLSFHPALDPGNRDLALWQRCGKHIPLPTVDLGRWAGSRGGGALVWVWLELVLQWFRTEFAVYIPTTALFVCYCSVKVHHAIPTGSTF